MLNEPPLDLKKALDAVAAASGLAFQHAEFIPKGEVAWCYKLTDRQNRAFLLRIATAAPTVPRSDIEKLRDLAFVITPVAIDGMFLQHEGYTLALYEFVAGATMWDQSPNAAQMEVTGRSFARLHQTARTKGPFAHREDFSLPLLDDLPVYLDRLAASEPPDAGAPALQLKRKLSPHLAFIEGEYDKLLAHQAHIRQREIPFVNCHGDPSPQNLIFADERMVLIDLDDLIYAPKEADLLYFSDHPHFESFMRGYRAIVPHATLDADIRAFYGRRWFLGEMTELCVEILERPHTADEYAHYLEQVDDILEDVGLG